MLTVAEAARILGIKESTIRSWILKRRIGYVKLGRRLVRIPQKEVDRLIAEGTIPRQEVRREGR